MLKNRKQIDRLWLEGNNGGDHLLIEVLDPDTGEIYIEVGHCCVKVMKHRIPVEWLTAVLSKLLLTASPEELMSQVEWPEDYVTALTAKIKKGRYDAKKTTHRV